MWVIAKNALRERIRRKELYIVVAVGILILLLCSSGTATITMNGEPITSFDNMIVVMHTMVAAVGCLLEVVLGIRTIPNEYERKDSHLVWVRGISQPVYHGGLALANILSAMLATGILYLALAVYIVANGRTDCQRRTWKSMTVQSVLRMPWQRTDFAIFPRQIIRFVFSMEVAITL